MFTATYIRRHINRLIDDKPFSIRDFLSYGTREAVDQVFYRLVKSGRIKRVARGVFIKETAPFPSAQEVAEVKAMAFGKRIAMHGKDVLVQFGIHTSLQEAEILQEADMNKQADMNKEASQEEDDNKRIHFVCNGRSSSFQFGSKRIYLQGVSVRKFLMENNPIGLLIRALWCLGKIMCSAEIVSVLTSRFNRTERRLLRQSAWIMPAWMCEYFPIISAYSRS